MTIDIPATQLSRWKSEDFSHGAVQASGKTKVVRRTLNSAFAAIQQADALSAGDGAKRDVIPGKGILANETACHIFRLLKDCGQPVAFEEQVAPDTFVGHLCKMYLKEVVVRREAHGSLLQRYPHIPKGHYFPKLLVEFFLKTKDKRWDKHSLPCDDPLMVFAEGASSVQLYNPHRPMIGQEPFLVLQVDEVFSPGERAHVPDMLRLAKNGFLIREKAFQILGYRYVDDKVEFGIDAWGNLRIADEVNGDSFRLIDKEGRYVDKQYYRDGGDLEGMKKRYELIAELTSRFGLPAQRIILWTASEKDDIRDFMGDVGNVDVKKVCHSAHKESVRSQLELNRLVQEVPDSVVIAIAGRSNGLGPTLAPNTHVPVITVPANLKDFREDIWSSLRAPSANPVMTVLDPSNAMLAAKNILAARNPYLYMLIRSEIEKRQVNVIEI